MYDSDSGCPRGRYGVGCARNCSCDRGDSVGLCDPATGRCSCDLGWTGADCREPCLPGRYGEDCSLHCRCRHAAACHPVTGRCDCSTTPGWYGPLCDVGELLQSRCSTSKKARIMVGVGHRHCTTVGPSVSHLSPSTQC